MPKPKFQRADAFDQSKPTTPGSGSGAVPYINAKEANSAIYENGASSFPMSGFEDPVEKQNEALKGQIADLMEQIQSRTSDLVAQDGTLIVQGFQFTPTGLIVPQDVELEAWEQVGAMLQRLEGSIQWLIGDWFAYAQNVKWGEATVIAERLGYEASTIHSYASVCRAVDSLIRIKELSFAHHRLVMGLSPDQQVAWLQYAAAKNLSVAAFRRELDIESTPALSSGLDTDKSYKAMKKLIRRNPATAKVEDHEEARRVYAEMQAAIKAFGQQWGIE
jgi:hypothetical protein